MPAVVGGTAWHWVVTASWLATSQSCPCLVLITRDCPLIGGMLHHHIPHTAPYCPILPPELPQSTPYLPFPILSIGGQNSMAAAQRAVVFSPDIGHSGARASDSPTHPGPGPRTIPIGLFRFWSSSVNQLDGHYCPPTAADTTSGTPVPVRGLSTGEASHGPW